MRKIIAIVILPLVIGYALGVMIASYQEDDSNDVGVTSFEEVDLTTVYCNQYIDSMIGYNDRKMGSNAVWRCGGCGQNNHAHVKKCISCGKKR